MKLFVLSMALFALSPLAVTAAEPVAITNADISNITNTTALVTWQTSRESTTTATYSQNPCPCQQGLSDPPDRMVVLHSVSLSGLTADRTYYVQTTSMDRDGNRTEGPILHFTTLHDASLPTAVLSNVMVGSVSDNATTVTWTTDVGIRGGSGVEYGVSPCPCSQNVQIDLGTATDHHVELAPLDASTTYYIRPFSYHPKDANTIQYGASKTFTTNAGSATRSHSTLVQLLYPNGGQQWNQAEQHLIAWKIAPGFVKTLRVGLLNDKGERIVLTAQLTIAQSTNGNAVLLLPSSLPSGAYTVELANAENPDDRDTSDTTITIGTVSQPTPTPPPPPALPLVDKPAPTFGPAPATEKPAPTPTLQAETPSTAPAQPTPPAAGFIAAERTATTTIDQKRSLRLSGRILLQVQQSGAAWYVNPVDHTRSFLGRPADAFALMRKLGLGVHHTVIEQQIPQRLAGRILIDVDDYGKAYYVDPTTRVAHFLGRPADAFALMRKLGLGISDSDIHTIAVAE